MELSTARTVAEDRTAELSDALARVASLTRAREETERLLEVATRNLASAEDALDALRGAHGDTAATAAALNTALDDARRRGAEDAARADRLEAELQRRAELHSRELASAAAAERAAVAAAVESERAVAAEARAATTTAAETAAAALRASETRAAGLEAALATAQRRAENAEVAARAATVEAELRAQRDKDAGAALRLQADAYAQQIEGYKLQLSQIPLAQQRAAEADARAEKLAAQLQKTRDDAAAARAAGAESGAAQGAQLERQWRDLHARLKAELAAAVRENERIAAAYSHTLDGLTDAGERGRAAEAEAAALRDELAALEQRRQRDHEQASQHMRSAYEIAARNEALEAELRSARAGTQDAVAQLAAAQQGVLSARDECHAMRGKQDQLHGLIAALQRHVGELEARVEAVPQLRAAWADAAGAYDEMRSAASEANEEARVMQARANELGARVAESLAAAAAAARERDTAVEERTRLARAHEALRQKYAQRLAEAAAAKTRFEEELTAERTRAAVLAEAERHMALGKESAEKERRAATEQHARETTELRSRLETLLKEYEALVKSKLRGEQAAVAHINDTVVKDLRADVRRWEAEAKDLTARNAALQTRIDAQTQQLHSLQITVQQQPVAAAQVATASSHANAATAAVQAQLDALTQAQQLAAQQQQAGLLAEAEAARQAAVASCRDFEARYEECLMRVDKLHAEKQELADEVHMARGRGEDLAEALTALQQEYARATAELGSAKAQVSHFELALTKAEEVARSQTALLDSLTQAGEGLKLARERANTELAAAATRIEESQRLVTQLRGERDAVNAELAAIRENNAREMAKLRDAHTQDVFQLREHSFAEAARLKEDHQRELIAAREAAASAAAAAAKESAAREAAAAKELAQRDATAAREASTAAAERTKEAQATAAAHAKELHDLATTRAREQSEAASVRAREVQDAAAAHTREVQQLAAEHARELMVLRSEHSAAVTVLEGKAERAAERIADAEARQQELTQQLAAATRAVAETKHALEGERERAERALTEGRALDSSVKRLESALADAKTALQDRADALAAVKEELDKTRRESARALDEQRVQLQGKEAELALTAKQLHSATERGNGLEARAKQAEDTVAAREREGVEARHRAATDLAGVEGELDRSRAALAESERRAKAAAAEAAARAGELVDVAAAARLQNERLVATERALQELEDENNRAKKEFESLASELRSEIIKRGEELERAKHKLNKLRLDVEERDLQVASLNERIKNMESLKGTDVSDMARRRANEAEARALNLEFQLRHREAELQDTARARRELEARLRGAEERVAALQFLPHEVNRLKHLENAFQAEVVARRQCEDDNARSQAELRVSKADVARLTAQADEAERAAVSAREDVVAAERLLRSERAAASERADRLKDDAQAALKAAGEKADELVRDLRGKIAEAATAMAQKEGEIQCLKLKVEALLSKAASQQVVSLEESRALIVELEGEVRRLRQGEAQLGLKLASAKSEAERLSSRVQDAEVELQQLRDAHSHPALRAQVRIYFYC